MICTRSAPENPARRTVLLSGAALLVAGCAAAPMTSFNDAEPVEGVGKTVVVDGTPLHFQRLGAGPPVVVIHGASGNLRDWTYRPARELARDHTVFAFDRPGLGRSGVPAGVTDLSVQARMMRQALRDEGVERATIIGHSYGGAVALAWALDAPESVTGLMLLAAPSHVWPGDIGWTSQLLAKPVVGPVVANSASAVISEDYATAAAKSVFAPQPVPDGYVAHLDLGLVLQPTALRSNALQLVALKEQLRMMTPHYSGLAMPVEVLHGDADKTVYLDIHSAALAREAPHARLTVLEGVGHMPHHAALPQVREALERLDSA